MWILSNTFPRATNLPSSPHAGEAGNGYQGPSEQPLEILDRRYAAGGLSRLEYDTMRGDLGSLTSLGHLAQPVEDVDVHAD